jgi:hypothetical protein
MSPKAALVLTAVWLAGCGLGPTRGATEADPTEAPAPVVQAPPPAPPPTPTGRVAGAAVAGAAVAFVPPVEQGLSGLLQAVPRLRERRANDVADAWLAVKKIGDPRDQERALDAQALDLWMCTDLVDLRAFEREGLPPFGWRDRTRNRTFVTPALGAILVKAYRALLAERPEARVSLGDLAQEGCGPLEYGNLVRWLEGAEARRMLGRARLEAGVAVAYDERTAADYGEEAGRFTEPGSPVVEEHRITGWTGDPERLRIRVETRRYWSATTPDRDELDGSFRIASRLVARGMEISSKRVRTYSPAGGTRELWRQHFVDMGSKRQVVTYSSKRLRRGADPGAVEEMRFSAWRPGKPRSYAQEIRWARGASDAADGARPWERSLMVHEAGHVTHLAGEDADISWVTDENRRHFAVDLGAMDVAGTWAWLGHLETAAREVGVPIDRILIDPKIRRHLERRLTREQKRTSLWTETIRLASGHDGHHHLRLTPPGSAANLAGLTLLRAMPTYEPAAAIGSAEAGVEAAGAGSSAAAAAKPAPIAESTPTPSK